MTSSTSGVSSNKTPIPKA